MNEVLLMLDESGQNIYEPPSNESDTEILFQLLQQAFRPMIRAQLHRQRPFLPCVRMVDLYSDILQIEDPLLEDGNDEGLEV